MKTSLVVQGSLFHGSVLALLLATAVAGAGCSSTSPGGGSDKGTGGKRTGGGGNTSVTVGTGGTPGAGIGGFTGTGNTGVGGGTVVVQKACATKVTLMNPVLLNFETYDGSVTADKYGTAFGGATPNTGTSYTGPYSFGDGTVTPMLEILAGHPPSQWAVSQRATQARAWGMGGGLWMGPACANASAYKGISFWVRGSGPLNLFNFSMNTENTSLPDAANPAGGGTCAGTADTCKPPTKADIPLTMDWTQVSILWSDFAPGMAGGTAYVPNGDLITGFSWSVPLSFTLDPSAMGDAAGPYVAVAGDLVINIDDVAFIP